MRVKFLAILSLLVVYNLCLNKVTAQNMDETTDASTLAQETLFDGIKLAKSKKLTKAAAQLEASKNYWQFHNSSLLYLTIIDDVNNEVIKKKTAVEIFKSVYEEVIKNEPKKAFKKINKIVKKDKSYFPAHIIRAEILTNLEDYDQAESEFETAIELEADSPLPYMFRGKYYVKMQNPINAVEDFTRAIQLDQGSAINHFERGFVRCLQKKYDSAIKDFETAVKVYPSWEKSTAVFEAFHNRGVSLLQNGSNRNAIKYFSRAIKIRPDYSNAYINRGTAYKKIKKYDKAISDFSYCIQKEPGHESAYYNRAMTNYDRGQYQKSIDDLETSLGFNSRNLTTLIKLGQCYSKLGEHSKAVVQFDKVLKLNNKNTWAYYWKGFSLVQLRKPKQAVQSFKTFLALSPKKYYKQIALAEVEIKKLKSRYGI